jgi:hypothetical protein
MATPSITDDEIRGTVIPHLRGQFEHGTPILFTGAGFSLDAKNIAGDRLPTGGQLRDSLWGLCFPGEPVDHGTPPQDLYEYALIRHPKALTDLLKRCLTVDAESVPEYYSRTFSMPWHRCYTLNIDDLASATARKYQLPRTLKELSSLNDSIPVSGQSSTDALDVLHLNGDLSGIPDRVTFSLSQYSERLSRHDSHYIRLTAELVSHSFVFIGTQLEESPLWQHIELRRSKGGRGLRELRPRSYLVTPALNLARQALLAEYNVLWIPMTAEQFANEVLAALEDAAATGHRLLARNSGSFLSEADAVPDVGVLANAPHEPSDFLLGQEPIWADLQSGRAITRENDECVWGAVRPALGEKGYKGLVVVTGTAGSGKSTSLRRVALRLSAEGVRVGWVNVEDSISPRQLRRWMRSDGAQPVLAIDDADMYGQELVNLVREIATTPPYPLVIAAIRSGRIDHLLPPALLGDVPYQECAMPPLSDRDIDDLIEVLDREHRLGILTGKPRTQQRSLFRDQAGRQLLVAMIQATSGRRFEEKVMDELTDLGEDAGRIYGLICVASAFRFGLFKSEILIALGDQSNTALNSAEALLRRHLVRAAHDGSMWARHRTLAEVVRDKLEETGQIKDLITGLAFLAATKVRDDLSRSTREWRMLRAMINHDFLRRAVGLEVARNLYSYLENLLHWDYHYWLQRGSFEVEVGDLDLAENFLNSAKSLAPPNDPFIENERAYLYFSKAIAAPTTQTAQDLVKESVETLQYLIQRVGAQDAYPYHVLGSQGLAWARRGISNSQQKERFLRGLIAQVEDGCRKHPKASDLQQLLQDLRREQLEVAIPVQRAFPIM